METYKVEPDTLQERAEELAMHGGYHRLLLVVGRARSGKTAALRGLAETTGWPLVNLSLSLSTKLLEVPSRFRQIRALDLLRDIAGEASEAAGGAGIILDNNELLFDMTLQQDPLSALLTLSRTRVVVASWCRVFDAGALTYAAPGHPEYRRYPEPCCAIFTPNERTPTERTEREKR